jgi:acyl-CoA synthetase (AMP-forming)/AMP-acid ligase II
VSLLAILEERACKTPDRVAFCFSQNRDCTFGELWRGICNAGSFLLERGIERRARVLVVIPNSVEFFFAFYGAQRAGGVAVPVFPGLGVERILTVAGLADASVVLVSGDFPEDKLLQLRGLGGERGIDVFGVEDCLDVGKSASFPEIGEDDAAFIQFTSGSTGDPKGVELTHGNLLTNIRQMIAGMEISEADSFVSWLPVYHDMGLILMTMAPFYLGIPLTILPTGLNYLDLWLRTIHQTKATFTAAPDFAYRLSLLYVKQKETFDLSSLRVALNAAEPVRATTIRKFEKAFDLENVLLPAYGLAEATVGVCSWKPRQPIKTDERGSVSVGKPFPGIQIKITNEVGEILVQSPANTRGYFRNPQATEDLFDDNGYIKTGDLGYLDEEGNLFVVGRKKNIIIQGGRNLSSREIEELIDQFQFVRRSAAIGIDRGRLEGEQAYIFIETRLPGKSLNDTNLLEDLSIEVVQAFHQSFGFRPGRVLFTKRSTIPITPNGKIQYQQLKTLYLENSLQDQGLILFPN